MTLTSTPLKQQDESKIQNLFDNGAPLLLEVRFPGMAAAPDWYLLNEWDELKPIVEKLNGSVELHFLSVFDIPSGAGSLPGYRTDSVFFI